MIEYILMGLYAAMGLFLVDVGVFREIRSGKDKNSGGMIIFLVTIMSIIFWPLIIISAFLYKGD